MKSTIPLDIPVWQDSWTNFLISPFISIFNLITSLYQIISSTMYFVFDLIIVTFSSSIVAIKLFGELFLNVCIIYIHIYNIEAYELSIFVVDQKVEN